MLAGGRACQFPDPCSGSSKPVSNQASRIATWCGILFPLARGMQVDLASFRQPHGDQASIKTHLSLKSQDGALRASLHELNDFRPSSPRAYQLEFCFKCTQPEALVDSWSPTHQRVPSSQVPMNRCSHPSPVTGACYHDGAGCHGYRVRRECHDAGRRAAKGWICRRELESPPRDSLSLKGCEQLGMYVWQNDLFEQDTLEPRLRKRYVDCLHLFLTSTRLWKT